MIRILAIVAFGGWWMQDPPKPDAPPPAKKPAAEAADKGTTPEKPALFKRKRQAPEDEKKSDAKKKTDDEPLQAEGGERMPPGPAKKGDAKPEGKLEGSEEELAKGLKKNLGAEDGDPLQRAGERMRQVEETLAKLKADEETTVQQEKIVADLKELLKRANQKNQKKQQQKQKQDQDQEQQKQKQGQQQPGQKQASQQSGKENRDKAGSARLTSAELAKMKEQRDIWGHLPEAETKLLNQSFKEDKLPEFRTALEKYYSKIAEQSNAKEK
jgi:DNA primase